MTFSVGKTLLDKVHSLILGDIINQKVILSYLAGILKGIYTL